MPVVPRNYFRKNGSAPLFWLEAQHHTCGPGAPTCCISARLSPSAVVTDGYRLPAHQRRFGTSIAIREACQVGVVIRDQPSAVPRVVQSEYCAMW
jgi:hypothetical protein